MAGRRRSKRQFIKGSQIAVDGLMYTVVECDILDGVETYEIVGHKCPRFTFSYSRRLKMWSASINCAAMPSTEGRMCRYVGIQTAIKSTLSW